MCLLVRSRMSKILKDYLTFGRRQAVEPYAGQRTAQ